MTNSYSLLIDQIYKAKITFYDVFHEFYESPCNGSSYRV